jgi:hypothetical protein
MFWKNRMFWFLKLDGLVFGRCRVHKSVLLNPVQQYQMVRVLETGEPRIFRSSDNVNETMTVEPDDWRTPLVRYLENSSHIADRKIR